MRPAPPYSSLAAASSARTAGGAPSYPPPGERFPAGCEVAFISACSLTAALFQRAQGLGERPLQPGEVVGLAVMMRRELVGPADRSVPHVFAASLDNGPDVADALGVGHC